MANNVGKEQDIVNQKNALKTTDTPLSVGLKLVYFFSTNKTVIDIVLTHPK